MRKRIILLIIILFLPVMVEAKEYCTIVSGNGKDIGSEIACGTEHFYVIDSSDDTVKMLSKYNLDVGRIYYSEEIEITDSDREKYNRPGISFDDNYLATLKCSDIAKEYRLQEDEENNYYNESTKKCVYFEEIKDKKVLQSSMAIGAHGDVSGNPIFPEYGVVLLNRYDKNIKISGEIYESGYLDGEFSETSKVFGYLNKYTFELSNMGFSIDGMNLITVNELNQIVKRISNKELPLTKWWNEDWTAYDDDISFDSSFYRIGSVKEYLKDGYEWLYSSTYWTRTLAPPNNNHGMFYDDNGNEIGTEIICDNDYYCEEFIYFIDTLGDLCNSSECTAAVGAGVRPVVTMNKENIIYNIKTKTDGNGTIEVVESAHGGEEIKFKVTTKKGYKLSGLTIITDSGEIVEFDEEDIISNSDGTMSISTNKFIMPKDSVLIEARWSFSMVNPSTGISMGFLLFMLLIISVSLGYVFSIRKKIIKK